MVFATIVFIWISEQIPHILDVWGEIIWRFIP